MERGARAHAARICQMLSESAMRLELTLAFNLSSSNSQKKADHDGHGRLFTDWIGLFQICVPCAHFLFRNAFLMNDMRNGGLQEDQC